MRQKLNSNDFMVSLALSLLLCGFNVDRSLVPSARARISIIIQPLHQFGTSDSKKRGGTLQVFGVANVTKMLHELPPPHREDCVNSLAYEADAGVQDPVYGCVGAISVLQQQTQLAIATSAIKTSLDLRHHHQRLQRLLQSSFLQTCSCNRRANSLTWAFSSF
ncbi:LOB domain-containing protein 25-like isoform X2 [Physcomitrium patens]|uniref:LOB domain-containing protein 25-like isoform X2 n=1 Tax=Physcomitrium patens TaxID=3218 RepID=UPI003CCD41ED